jgi:hypothetical protein
VASGIQLGDMHGVKGSGHRARLFHDPCLRRVVRTDAPR